jgi:truncated hemoglobin YjbI
MNLFQKYGGADYWSDFLNVFYTRITSSELLSYHFVDKDIDHIKSMLIGLLEVTLVSEGHYPEDVIRESHKNMGISNQELNEWIRIYTRTMQDTGIEEEDQKAILQIVESYRPHLVTKHNN